MPQGLLSLLLEERESLNREGLCRKWEGILYMLSQLNGGRVLDLVVIEAGVPAEGVELLGGGRVEGSSADLLGRTHRVYAEGRSHNKINYHSPLTKYQSFLLHSLSF